MLPSTGEKCFLMYPVFEMWTDSHWAISEPEYHINTLVTILKHFLNHKVTKHFICRWRCDLRLKMKTTNWIDENRNSQNRRPRPNLLDWEFPGTSSPNCINGDYKTKTGMQFWIIDLLCIA